MEDLPKVIVALSVIGMLFIGLPWLIFHYITRWKTAATLTGEDERMLAELHALAQRLDDRVATVERIVTADNPNWRAVACDPATGAIEAHSRHDIETEMLRRIK